MKFSVSKEKLIEGLQTVQNVVSTRTTLPILSNVLLKAENGSLRLPNGLISRPSMGQIPGWVLRCSRNI